MTQALYAHMNNKTIKTKQKNVIKERNEAPQMLCCVS
jgi:hypothetical protein